MFHRIIRKLSTTAENTASGAVDAVKKTKKIKWRDNRPIIQEQRARNEALNVKAAKAKLNWRLVCSIVLHRYPEIKPEKQKWELEYEEMEDKRAAIYRQTLMEKLSDSPDAMLTHDRSLTYEEIIESMPFKPASRITQADIDNNRRSMDRRLADSLILIVKRNRSDFSWQLPQSKMLPRETLRASAERVVKRAGGPKVCTWFVGNAPIGHYKYEYSEALQKKRKVFGAHVFFLRMQLLKKDSVVVPKKYFSDYAWIARDEVHEYFDPETARYMEHLFPY